MTAAGTSTATGARRRGPSMRRARAGRLFVAPNLAAVAVFMLFPLGFSLYMSLHNWDMFTPAKFVGLANYRSLFTEDPLFSIAMRNTLIYVVGTVVPTVLISLAVAGVLNRKIKGIAVFRTIIFVPLAVSSVVIAVVWQFVFNTHNGLTQHRARLGRNRPDPMAGGSQVGDDVAVHRQCLAQCAFRDCHLVGRNARCAGKPV